MTAETAIIVSNRHDIHAHSVHYQAKCLGIDARVIDIQSFTVEYGLTTRIGKDESACVLHDLDGPLGLDIRSVSGLWWRRPFPMRRKSGGVRRDDVEAAVTLERRSAIIGSLDALIPNAFNKLGNSQAAANKPTQLAQAARLGLSIPETLITTDPEAARDFIRSGEGEVIYKLLNSTSLGLFGTRRFMESDLENLDRLKFCPAIFQRFVRGSFDVRAVVVGTSVFAGRIDYDDLNAVPDTRFVPTRVSKHNLPVEIEEKLVQLVQSFGLVYSAIDLRFGPDNGYVFFESNPEGQFLWIEIEADLPISRAIAMRLMS